MIVVVLRCRFGRPIQGSCDDAKFWESVDTIWGRCFVLRMPKEWHASSIGLPDSIQLVLDLSAYQSEESSWSSLLLSLLSEDEPLLQLREPITLEPGLRIHIPMRLVEKEFHNPSLCSKRQLQISDRYSQTACELEDFIRVVRANCSCTPISAAKAKAPPNCTTLQELTCVRSLRESHFRHHYALWSSESCPNQCFLTQYRTSLIYSAIDENIQLYRFQRHQIQQCHGEREERIFRDNVTSHGNWTTNTKVHK